MLRFYYNKMYKYTNRTIIDVSGDTNYTEHEYENIDSPDTINGHIIYQLSPGEEVPTYVVDTTLSKKYFVSGITRLRTGKFQLSLLRDILSEAPEVWKNERAYISAGTAQDGDYCKYKLWGLPFTNTKVGSQRLNINGKSSFFVFYVNEQHQGGGGAITETDFQVSYTTLPGISSYDIEVGDLNDIPYYSYVNGGELRAWSKLAGKLNLDSYTAPFVDMKTGQVFDAYKEYNGSTTGSYAPDNLSSNYLRTNFVFSGTDNAIINKTSSIYNAIIAQAEACRDDIGAYVAKSTTDTLDAYVDKVIKVSTDYYRIKRERTTITHNDFIPKADTTIQTSIKSLGITTKGNATPSTSVQGSGCFYFTGTEELTTYTLEYLGQGTSFDFTFVANAYKLPKSAVRCVNIVPDEDFDATTIAQCLMLAQANPGVDSVEGSDANIGRIIDIQYLPFSVATQKNTDFVMNNTTSYLTAEVLSSDDFSYTTTLPTLTNINKETDSVVIVSPTRKSQFKFSPYNNNGRMVFDTRITIRPNQSVIYIRPSTQGLLMQDWDDKDCLIIQEDFSLTTINSAWTNYVYNNRNYQNAFNLQMQTKEFERTWERRVEKAQAKSDEWTARNISAQKAQTYTGNLPVISGIAGAIGTAWADENYMNMAKLDREYNEALYQKSMEVARTEFEYQIDNVKSQPLIPNTITAIDVKMLDGVYLETYSTNPTELASIQQYYQYNGNRIDNYGTFATYWGNFVRGKIIIAQNYTQPETDELNRRLELGVFTGGM